MRSISLKITLAFLAVSLISIALIAMLARFSTGQEFERFVFGQNRDYMVSSLEEYYRSNGSWESVDEAPLFTTGPGPFRPESGRPGPVSFTIVDTAGRVVRAGHPEYMLDEILPPSELEVGIPIQIDGVNVGLLLLGNEPFRENPLERDFIQRTSQFLLFSALGTVAVGLTLGILWSRNLTRPIRELTLAAQAISEGDLGRQVAVHNHDELGGLANAFNKMSADLARSTNARRQMSADIAHELRTPLSLILGHADAVHDGVLPPSQENFAIIREEASRLEHLVEDLRILSLADAGELSMTPQMVAPTKLLDEIKALYRHRAKQKNISLAVETTPGLPNIAVDPGRMTQVLVNILDNALRYTPEGGQVGMSARQTEAAVQLSIVDNGPGIAEDELDRLFDRFYQADPSRQRTESGSGLGLAIARSIVEQHNGTIRAYSTMGQGLEIVITLPLPIA